MSSDPLLRLRSVTNPDGTTTNNLLMMAAGKNVVVGDYLSQVTHWASGNTDFYTNFQYNSTTKKVSPVTGPCDALRDVTTGPA